MVTRSKYKKDPFMETSKIGEFTATTQQIVSALGYPTICNDHIPGGYMRYTLFEWRIRTPFGPVTIYDHKEWEDPDFAEDKLISWQVGARHKSYKDRTDHPVLKWVEQRLGVTTADTRYWIRRSRIEQGVG